MAGLNVYAFVVNNPVRWVDPLGYDFILYSPAAETLQWVLDDGTPILTLPDVVTGPFKKGALQDGHYKGFVVEWSTKPGFVCPGKTSGWKLHLHPEFDTRDAQSPDGRNLLRVHEDGGERGTRGCIGVPCGPAGDAVKMLLDVWFGATNSTIDVYVGGSPVPVP